MPTIRRSVTSPFAAGVIEGGAAIDRRLELDRQETSDKQEAVLFDLKKRKAEQDLAYGEQKLSQSGQRFPLEMEGARLDNAGRSIQNKGATDEAQRAGTLFDQSQQDRADMGAAELQDAIDKLGRYGNSAEVSRLSKHQENWSSIPPAERQVIINDAKAQVESSKQQFVMHERLRALGQRVQTIASPVGDDPTLDTYKQGLLARVQQLQQEIEGADQNQEVDPAQVDAINKKIDQLADDADRDRRDGSQMLRLRSGITNRVNALKVTAQTLDAFAGTPAWASVHEQIDDYEALRAVAETGDLDMAKAAFAMMFRSQGISGFNGTMFREAVRAASAENANDPDVDVSTRAMELYDAWSGYGGMGGRTSPGSATGPQDFSGHIVTGGGAQPQAGGADQKPAEGEALARFHADSISALVSNAEALQARYSDPASIPAGEADAAYNNVVSVYADMGDQLDTMRSSVRSMSERIDHEFHTLTSGFGDFEPTEEGVTQAINKVADAFKKTGDQKLGLLGARLQFLKRSVAGTGTAMAAIRQAESVRAALLKTRESLYDRTSYKNSRWGGY